MGVMINKLLENEPVIASAIKTIIIRFLLFKSVLRELFKRFVFFLCIGGNYKKITLEEQAI